MRDDLPPTYCHGPAKGSCPDMCPLMSPPVKTDHQKADQHDDTCKFSKQLSKTASNKLCCIL